MQCVTFSLKHDNSLIPQIFHGICCFQLASIIISPPNICTKILLCRVTIYSNKYECKSGEIEKKLANLISMKKKTNYCFSFAAWHYHFLWFFHYIFKLAVILKSLLISWMGIQLQCFFPLDEGKIIMKLIWRRKWRWWWKHLLYSSKIISYLHNCCVAWQSIPSFKANRTILNSIKGGQLRK